MLGLALGLCVCLAGCGGGSSGSDDADPDPVTPPGVLSISAYYYTEPDAANDAEWVQRYLQAYSLARSAGADGQFQSYHWSDLEPSVGHYDAAKLQDFASTLANGSREGLTQLVGPAGDQHRAT